MHGAKVRSIDKNKTNVLIREIVPWTAACQSLYLSVRRLPAAGRELFFGIQIDAEVELIHNSNRYLMVPSDSAGYYYYPGILGKSASS